MSNEQVRLVLNLEKRFEDKPALKEALVSGEVSVNKLARVVSIATPENDEALVAKELYELQKKGIDVNELLREFLVKRKMDLAREKEQLFSEVKPTHSRYIRVKVRRHLQKEHGDRCSIESCGRRAEEIHHTQRFGLSKRHDLRYLAPLCKSHHEIAHSIDLKYQVALGRTWAANPSGSHFAFASCVLEACDC